jgi:hypothetical protein
MLSKIFVLKRRWVITLRLKLLLEVLILLIKTPEMILISPCKKELLTRITSSL